MILNAIKYTRYAGEPREWSIEGKDGNYAYFGNINLLVGKNASGKSRTLNVIREIAGLLSGKVDIKTVTSPSGLFDLIFTDGDNKKYNYILSYKDRIITNEVLKLNDKILLDRKKQILFEESFSVDESQLAITLSDKDNKLYFEELVLWGNSLRNYLFANQLEKNHLVKDYSKEISDDEDAEYPEVLIHTFYKGKEAFEEVFIQEIIQGMEDFGYTISDIGIEESKAGFGLYVEEDGEYTVSQREMSQGMFRILSLLILLSYARLSNISFCLLVDDMGEGLDFERSKSMMDMVIRKVNKSQMQFFMTSNDRHVMNQISLRYWSVIGREGSKSVFYDYVNSQNIFDDFKYTGLNNFDFLATDFYQKGFGVIEEDND